MHDYPFQARHGIHFVMLWGLAGVEKRKGRWASKCCYLYFRVKCRNGNISKCHKSHKCLSTQKVLEKLVHISLLQSVFSFLLFGWSVLIRKPITSKMPKPHYVGLNEQPEPMHPATGRAESEQLIKLSVFEQQRNRETRIQPQLLCLFFDNMPSQQGLMCNNQS